MTEAMLGLVPTYGPLAVFVATVRSCFGVLRPVVDDIRARGATSLRAIAAERNARGMLTRRSGRWHVSTVTNLLDRLGVGEAACDSQDDVAH